MSGLSEAEVIAAWEAVARSPKAKSKIHPAGGDEVKYQRTGLGAALRIIDVVRWYSATHEKELTYLDYGCGDGRVLRPLQERGYEVFGYDTSPTMLERAAANGCTNLVDYASDLPRADVVFAVSVLIHHDHDTGADILRRMAALTRQGGLVIVTLPIHAVERVRSGWIDVTVWSPSRFRLVAAGLGLEPVREMHYLNPFTFAGSKTNDYWQVLRKTKGDD